LLHCIVLLEGLFDFVFVLIVDLGKVGEGKEGTAISWLHTGEQKLEEEGGGRGRRNNRFLYLVVSYGFIDCSEMISLHFS
jgi:hypothetical protein